MKGVAPSPTPRCSSYRKGAFGSPSTTVGNFTYIYIYICVCVCVFVCVCLSGKILSSVTLDGLRSQLEASCVSSHTEELWHNEIVCLDDNIYIYIYILSSHTSNTDFPGSLFFHPFQSSIGPDRSYSLHPVSAQNCCWWVLASRPTLAHRSVGFYWRMSFMSSSLLLRQLSVCRVPLT